ncbi:MAG TPA: choice-of-anchor D domain-containing protein [Verrucomicrobiae bacterium]|nr:choice-of-anchor D domain-containing protein [Verrucomicrobiae bacterium]
MTILSLVCGFAIACSGQTAFLDFNTAGQYTNNFNPWNDNGVGGNGGSYSFMESDGVGAGGSRGVSVFQSTDTTAAYNAGSWDFSTNGAVIVVSTLIKANAQFGVNKVQLGFMNVNNNGLNNNAGVAFESYRFIPTAAGVWPLYEQYRTANALGNTTLGTLNVVPGEWYKFVISATNTSGASGNYTAGCALYDYGSDGLTPGTNLINFSTVLSHTAQTDVTVSPVWPAFRAFQDAGIDAWDNFLVYTPSSPPVITLALTNTSAALGQPATFAALADGPGAIAYSWYTNRTHVAGASGQSYTTPPLTGSYTNMMVVASNTNGSATNSASISVFVPSAATVTNLAASAIEPTTATLNGRVLNTGGATPTITIYYGPSDGGTTPAAWANNVGLGPQSGSFSQGVAGLTPGTTYYFAAKAVNASGTSWATPSQSFQTLPINPPVVTNLPASGIQANAATLNGQVLSTGNDTPIVTLYYGPTDGGATASSWAQSVSIGLQSGSFAQTISGLSSNTTYYFTAAAVNSAGAAWAVPSQSFTTLLTNPPGASAVAVLTHHNDNQRTGRNLNETILNTSNVNSNQFGLLYTLPVDDQIYAQPLVMTNVLITGKGVHNLVIVVTVNDSVYAFDADDSTVTTPYWHTSFINPPNIVAPANTDESAIGACGGNYQDFSGNMGIVGTPVIDPATGTMYLVARTKENGTTFVQRLHALDVATGLDRPNSPVVITATYPGTGAGSSGGVVTFDSIRENQRPGLALVNGTVYISWSSHCDNGPYHGWVIGYDETTLQQVAVFNDTPNGYNGGIWMSGQPPAIDTNGNLYLSTGNGSVDTSGGPNRGESFLKLSRSGTNLTMTSWFTPYNWQTLENGDIDLGSGGLMLIPGTTLALSGGKEGILYLVNRDNMGGLTASTTTNDNIIQYFSVTPNELHGGAVWWDGPANSCAYIWPAAVNLQQYVFNGSQGRFTLPAFAQSPTAAPNGQPGALLALSANGAAAGSGIVWAAHQLTGDANQSVRPGILRAYDAQNVSRELWNSQQNSARDAVGNFAKFVPPTVANGKVYLATFSNRLNVYGLLASITPPALSLSPGNLSFGTLVTGQNSNKTFRVVNNGGQTLNGAATVTGPFSISGGSPFSLSSGQTGFVQVAFSPTTGGSFSNAVVFSSNGGNSTNTVTGSAVTPGLLAVSPATVNYGTVAVGSNVQATLVVTNEGGLMITNGTVTVAAGPFAVVSGASFTVPGFGSSNVVVRFAPTSAGSFSNAAVFASSGGGSTNALLGVGAVAPVASFTASPTSGTPPLLVSFADTSTGTITNRLWNFGDGGITNTTLSGVNHSYAAVGTYAVSLTVNGPVGTNTLARPGYVVVTNVPALLALSPASWAYGSLITGQSSNKIFQVVNNGGQTLNGTATTATPFSISAGSPFTVSPGQTGLVQVAFSPTTGGSFSNVVVFRSNGGNSTNTVTGSAVTPGLLVVSPASINYGTVAVGSNVQAILVITNEGGLMITNGTVTVAPGPFAVVSGASFTVPGFGSSNVVVRFAPTSAGSFSNAAVFASSGGGSTNALLGVGAVAPVASFTGTPTSGAWPLLVSFTDSSTGTITNRFWNFGDGVTTNTTGTNLTHGYGATGTNTVTLTVSGPVGTNTLTEAGYIVVTNAGPVTITISVSGNQAMLTWPIGTLQTAVQVMGPYTNIVGATSPYPVTPSEAARFFRIQVH